MKNNRLKWGALLLPIFLFYLSEAILYHPFTDLTPGVQLYNLLLFMLLFALSFSITGGVRSAFALQSAGILIYTLVNYYVLRFRSKPLLPPDVFSLGTAVSVAENYDYMPGPEAVAGTLGILLLNLIAFRLFRDCGFRKRNSRYSFSHRQAEGTVPASAAGPGSDSSRLLDFPDWGKQYLTKRVSIAVIFLCALFLWGLPLFSADFCRSLGMYDRPYTPDQAARHNGLLTAFVSRLEELPAKPPAGYTDEAAEALLNQYQPVRSKTTEKVNLVIMMNEAFSDLSVLGDFPVNEDPIPYARGLMEGKENCSGGLLHVSVLGGNTANTEFEVLTGFSMAFLPDGTIPYQQYVRQETESLASILRDEGYRTVALHPYYATGWRRNKAYPLMGFQETRFIDEFRDPTYLRDYVDDASCVKEIERLFEEKGRENLFVFNVTMQNHSSFIRGADNLEERISTGLPEAEELDRYLSLLRYSDEALAKLTAYLRDYPEPVMLVMFGDHQPGLTVSGPILKANGTDPAELGDEDYRRLYEVPFFIWTNYGKESVRGMNISANFLGNEILSGMGVPLTPFRQFLEEKRAVYPVLSTQGLEDINGKRLFLNEERPALSDYALLQYHGLFRSAR